jgi:hypothetical protein
MFRAAWPWWRRAFLKHAEATLVAAAWIVAIGGALLLLGLG